MVARLIIAGTHSSVGKTTLTVGLIAALRQHGLTVQPFKAGPDYIDPSYHTLANSHNLSDAEGPGLPALGTQVQVSSVEGRPCRNLDTWMVPPDRVRALFTYAAHEADVAIIEGVMGLYDGFGYEDETGSAAQLAKLLSTPVVLVLDASKMARSAAALALGYQRFDPDLPLAGFIVNRVGGDSHGRGVATAIQKATSLPVLGWLPRDPALEIPERHLGLVPTAEPGHWNTFVEAAADRVARHLDLDRLLRMSAVHSPPSAAGRPILESLAVVGARRSPDGGRPIIAVARDEAFSFMYEENLDLLRAVGAEIAFFSPLNDAALPRGTTGVILSGGFPEFYADQLAANTSMRRALRRAHNHEMPIYAECGGLMYLTEAITDLEGREYPMIGLLPGRSVMSHRLTLGYRLAQATGDSWLLRVGETVRGHEFHYSVWEARPTNLPPAYHLLPPDGQGDPQPEGVCLGNLWASYVHLHFWNKPELAVRFVSACRRGGEPR